MENIQEGANTAVETAQTGTASTEVAATPQISEGTEVKTEVSAEAHSDQKTSEQPNESRYEKAFAARLKKEQEKLEAKYSKHDFVLKKAAAENGLTLDEYLDTIEKNYKEKELEAIDPSIREDVLWAREKRAKEAEETKTKGEAEKWNSEVSGLLKMFPDVKSAKDIPDEVLEYRLADNVPLEYAYAKYALGKERTKIEQETLKKLRENEASSVGSMASSSTDTKLKISDMDDKDFEKLMNEVRRGTRKSL